MRASMVTLLPDPDSPTMPRISRSSSVTLTPSTACMTPEAVGKSTERFLISRSGMGLALEFGIERVAQPVAEEIEGQHRDEDEEPREGHDPPGAQHEHT